MASDTAPRSTAAWRGPAARATARLPLANRWRPQTTSNAITLDDMVLQYLRAQHAKRHSCSSVVPVFSLLSPRRWQPTKAKDAAAGPRHPPRNVVNRLRERERAGAGASGGGSAQMRHLVYSKFRQASPFKVALPSARVE